MDVEDKIWTIDLNIIKKNNKKTKAIMIVHVYGQPCKIDEIKNLQEKKIISYRRRSLWAQNIKVG